MTINEYAVLAHLIECLYAGYEGDYTNEFSVRAWHDALEDIDFYDAKKAIKAHARTFSEPPSIAEIRKFVKVYRLYKIWAAGRKYGEEHS